MHPLCHFKNLQYYRNMKNGLLLVVELLTIFLGLLAIGLLLFANPKKKFANRLLAANIACTTLYMLAAALSQTNFFFRFPHFYRAFYPFYLLIYPLAYLYIRALFLEQQHFKRSDLWHLMPAIAIAVQFIPFYAIGTEEKRRYLQMLFTNQNKLTFLNEGWLPEGVISIVVYIIGLLYMVSAIRILIQAKEKGFYTLNKIGRWPVILSWIAAFIINHIIIPAFFFTMLAVDPPLELRFFIIVFVQAILLSSLLIYLFMRPQILYGFPSVQANPDIHHSDTSQRLAEVRHKQPLRNNPGANGAILSLPQKEGSLKKGSHENSSADAAYLQGYTQIVQDCFLKGKVFLKHGYCLKDLSAETGIPQHHLTALFNKIWGQRFNDYVNQCRVNYIADNKDNPEWEKMTIEGIGWAAGFNSRITLFKAIKKQTGLSPSSFLKRAIPDENESL